MSFKRREFLLFLGAGLTTATLAACQDQISFPFWGSSSRLSKEKPLKFKPLKGPMPLLTSSTPNPSGEWVEVGTLSNSAQIQAYENYEIVDDVVLPEGFTYDIIATWGDPVGKSRFGYNNDYLSFVETHLDEGFLTVNFEYISPKIWIETYEQVMGKSLPLEPLKKAFNKESGTSQINGFALKADDPIRQAILEISLEALTDVGIGVISLRKNEQGQWIRTYSKADRRITGMSGWLDGHYLKATGPAVAVFRKKGQGYRDRLGDKIIGTFGNCAGGTSPWGTVFSAEENFQINVPESVYPDGTSYDPKENSFSANLDGLGNVLGLAGNKYGWMVEVDPANPQDYGTKHTWLGRYRHEAVGIRAVAGQPLAVYSGCDRRGGHLYKFISRDAVKNPQDQANSGLLGNGMLYAAQFNSDGTGRWIPLKADTPVNPNLPSVHFGEMIALPKRPNGGSFNVTTDEAAIAFRNQFKTLADLYIGNTPEEQQGAILIDAHLAASAVGATCTARPEDTDIAADGSLFIAFTSGLADENTGGPDRRIFKSPLGDDPYEYGWVMRLIEDRNAPDAKTFRWQMFATGGEVPEGGLGFANPDNLAFDAQGDLWMVTDMSTNKHNQAVGEGRVDAQGKPLKSQDLLGLFGNNAAWFLPTSGEQAGQAFLFAIGPMECELTGPFFSPDQTTLFLAVQHPGEYNGTRQNLATKTLKFALQTTQGEPFTQSRTCPIGSNWPGKRPNDPPKPAVIAVRRIDSKPMV